MALLILSIAALLGLAASPWWSVIVIGAALAALEVFDDRVPRPAEASTATAYAFEAFRIIAIVRGIVAAAAVYGAGYIIGSVLLHYLARGA